MKQENIERMVLAAGEAIELPKSPKSLRACHVAIAKAYAAAYAVWPNYNPYLLIIKREASSRLGEENLRAIEVVVRKFKGLP